MPWLGSGNTFEDNGLDGISHAMLHEADDDDIVLQLEGLLAPESEA